MSLTANALALLGNLFLPGGRNGRLSIIMYHDVIDAADPLRPSATTLTDFEHDMSMLNQCFNVLKLDEAVDALDAGTLPPRAVVITFDDGYQASVKNAVPVLRRFGFSAIWYLVPGLFDGAQMWNDRAKEAIRLLPSGELDLSDFGLGVTTVGDALSRNALLGRVESAFYSSHKTEQEAVADYLADCADGDVAPVRMLTADEVRELRAAGMEVGSHTRSHPVLATLEPDQAREEMRAGRQQLEAILGEAVPHFAYPVGRPGRDFRAEHAGFAEQLGMKSAVTTGWGVSQAATDRFQLPRFTPWDRTAARYALRMFYNGRFVRPRILDRDAAATVPA